jgi:hypothetical protein
MAMFPVTDTRNRGNEINKKLKFIVHERPIAWQQWTCEARCVISDEECALWHLAVATRPVPGALEVYLDWLLTHDPRRGEVLERQMRGSASSDENAAATEVWREALGLSARHCTTIHFNPLPYILYMDAYPLTGLEPVLDRLPFLEIFLECGCPSDKGLALITAQPAIAKIRRLRFSAYGDQPSSENYQSFDREYYGNQVLAALCASPQLAELEELEVSESWMDPAYGRALAAGHFRNLRRLAITSFPIGDGAVAELAASPVAAKLSRLSLANQKIEDAGAIAIATHLKLLGELDVRWNKIGPAGEAALRSLPVLRELLI